MWGDIVHLSRIAVSGFRASAEQAMTCDLPGRFSVLIGANGAGKTTLTDALYLAHPTSRFPVLPRYGSATLAPERSTRSIEVSYKLGDSLTDEGRLGRQLHEADHRPLGHLAESWGVTLSRRLGGVATKIEGAHGRSLDLDPYKLIYLPAWRHPLDELARREARILVELLRAEQQRLNFNFLAEQVDDAEPRMPEPPDPIQVGFEWVPLERLGDVYLLPRINRPLSAALSGELTDPFVDRW
ncbi:AAA family ATPase [Streptomyces sp. NPDC056399]|uniref:AAA family ATPase n=1 Tax=Streptomyces sp. NPDC056399 TaxID=3345807 RepID=UPI0035D81934